MMSVVVSLRNAYSFMHLQLTMYGIDEPDLAWTLVQQIATTVINHNQVSLPPQSLGKIYEQIVQVTGCHIDHAAAICRHADDLIATEIIRLMPDFGGALYRGIVSHAFILQHDVRIFLRPPVASD